MNSFEIEKQNLQLRIARTGGGFDGVPIISQLPTTAPDVNTTNAGLIDNLLDNTDFDFSKDGYTNATPAGGDIAQECYNFYRHRLIRVTDAIVTNGSPTVDSATGPFKSTYTYPMSFVLYGAGASGATLTGTLTRVSDTQATLSTNALVNLTNGILWIGDALAETAAQALKATAHTLFAANEGTNLNIPRWERTNGWVEIGSNTSERWSLDAPFAQNVIRPGLPLFAIAIVKQRDTAAAMPDGCRLYFGCWDDTPGQDKWIEGENFDLTVSPQGTPGSTSVSYKAVGILSDGSEIESDVVTITNSAAVLNASNYNRLTWTNAPGILDFTIYRLMGGVYHRVFTITNGANDFNDTGGFETVVGGFPTTNQTKAIAYKETSTVFPPNYASGWIAVGVSTSVPSTYDTAPTTGRQWFRGGIVGQTPDNRNVLLDRLGVATSSGGWNRSARDRSLIASTNPDSTPPGSDQGDTGIDPRCFEKMTLIKVANRDGSLRIIQIGELEKGTWVWDGARGLRRCTKVRHSKSKCWLVLLDNGGWFRATPTEKFVTSRADKDGTTLGDLLIGDTILSPTESGTVSAAVITAIDAIEGEFDVVTPSFDDGHIFAAGNMTGNGIVWALAHNEKPDIGNQF